MISKNRNQVLSNDILYEGWVTVRRVRYVQARRDGTSQSQDRDLQGRGDGVTTLLFHPEKNTVLLLRQPRIVATLRGDIRGETLEACSGMLGDIDPHARARQEIIEETGYFPLNLVFIASVYESPGGSVDLIHLFLAEYDDAQRAGEGGGSGDEGEDIEVLEVPLLTALELVKDGHVRDARTILLLQHLALREFRPTA